MKAPNIQDRNRDILAVYSQILKTSDINIKYMSRDSVVDIIMSATAPRYYTTSLEARRHVLKYLKFGTKRKNICKDKQTAELADKYIAFKKNHKYMKEDDIWENVVNSPASSFFVSPRTITEIIYQYNGRC